MGLNIIIVVYIHLFIFAVGINNGKGLKPPMGWRSWNLFGDNVTQYLIHKQMWNCIPK